MDTQFLTQISLDWSAEFAAWLERQGRAENTIKAYLQDLRMFSRFFEETNGEPFTPHQLNRPDLAAWRAYSLDVRRVAPSTWNRRLATLQVFCAWCRAQGLLTYDPLAGIEPMEVVSQPPKWLEQRDYGRLLRRLEIEVNAANTELRRVRAIRDAAMVGLMVHAGLRVGEVVALQMAEAEISERRGRVVVRRGKGDKYRAVPLSLEARRLLSAWLAVRPASGQALFTDDRGAGLSERAVQKRVDRLAAGSGVDDLTPHRFRHTFVKRILDAGHPVTEAQKLAGHRSTATTARYGQPGWEDLEEAVEAVVLGKQNRGGSYADTRQRRECGARAADRA